jgi:hypothetical protein
MEHQKLWICWRRITHHIEQGSSQQQAGDNGNNYNMGEGSIYHLLFGDEQAKAITRQSALPNLNELFPEQ